MGERTFILFPEYQRLSTHFTRTDYSLFFKNVLLNYREEKECMNVHSSGSPIIGGLMYTLLASIARLSQIQFLPNNIFD